MKFKLIINSGIKRIAEVEGKEVDEKHLPIADLNKVIEVEQFLERLFGLRFHISE